EAGIDAQPIVQLYQQALITRGGAVFQSQPITTLDQLAHTVIRRLTERCAEPQRQLELALQQTPAGRVKQIDETDSDQAQVGQRTAPERPDAGEPELLEWV